MRDARCAMHVGHSEKLKVLIKIYGENFDQSQLCFTIYCHCFFFLASLTKALGPLPPSALLHVTAPASALPSARKKRSPSSCTVRS